MVNGKNVLQRLWKDKMTVTEYQKVILPDKSTGFKEVAVLEDIPCKLSFSSLNLVQQDNGGYRVVQTVKLFFDNSIEIKPGSKITVKRRTKEYEYSQSGQPGVFTHHQEITLTPFVGWA